MIVVAGAVNGVAGFGFALIGTMALATVMDPATAVVFMIIPIIAVNVSLVRELSVLQLRRCGRRFWPVLAAALVGTLVGMALLDVLPAGPLRVLLGLVTLGFVLTAQRLVPIPRLSEVRRHNLESRTAMLGIGGASGLLFGGTNVGVQLVAYVRSFDLEHDLFVGVVAMLFLGLNAVRVLFAGTTGMYPGVDVAIFSVVAGVPAALGVFLGKHVRDVVSPTQRQIVVLGLLTLIGIRLILAGAGIY